MSVLESLLKRVLSRTGLTWKLLLKELSAFGVVGAACFVVDLGLFQLLYAHAGIGAVTSKGITTIASTTLAYLGHRFWSFSHRERTGVRREYTIFFLVNGVTLLIGLVMVAAVRYPLGQDGALALQITNIISIGLGTVIRFVAYRRWVFVSPDAPAAIAHRQQQESRQAAREAAGSTTARAA